MSDAAERKTLADLLGELRRRVAQVTPSAPDLPSVALAELVEVAASASCYRALEGVATGPDGIGELHAVRERLDTDLANLQACLGRALP